MSNHGLPNERYADDQKGDGDDFVEIGGGFPWFSHLSLNPKPSKDSY
jgi:hypothetical protein